MKKSAVGGFRQCFFAEVGIYRKEFIYILNKVKLYIQYMEHKIIYQNI